MEGLKLLGEISSDLARLAKLPPSYDFQFKLRLQVRTIFSVLDALCFFLKSRALERCKDPEATFSKTELGVLREGQVRKNPDGTESWRKIFPPPDQNIRTSARCYAQLQGSPSPLDGQLPIPASFNAAAEVRHRLTHPKKLADLTITSDEFAAVRETVEWLFGLFEWAFDSEKAYILALNSAMSQSIEKVLAAVRSPTTK